MNKMKYINNIVLSLFLSFGLYSIGHAQCDFIINAPPGESFIEVLPNPGGAINPQIISFLDDNSGMIDLMGDRVRFNLINPPTESEVLGVYSILCGDIGCDYEIFLGTNTTGPSDVSFMNVRPFLTEEQIDAIDAQYPIDVANQFSTGATFIRFENELDESEAAEIREIIESFCPDPIPTIGEWGLIALAFLLMIVGVVAVRSRRYSLQH